MIGFASSTQRRRPKKYIETHFSEFCIFLKSEDDFRHRKLRSYSMKSARVTMGVSDTIFLPKPGESGDVISVIMSRRAGVLSRNTVAESKTSRWSSSRVPDPLGPARPTGDIRPRPCSAIVGRSRRRRRRRGGGGLTQLISRSVCSSPLLAVVVRQSTRSASN